MENAEVEKKGIGKAKAGLIVCVVLIVILAISCAWLFMRLDSLQKEVDYLTTENDDLLTSLGECIEEKWILQEEMDYLQEEIELAQFDFYYVLPVEQSFGVYALDDELHSGDWVDPYEVDVFDCSEMSAYMEWELENLGWHTIIVAGDSPFGSGRHAWLLVETSEGKYMPVEATTLEVVWWDDPYFDNYWEYDYEFETILDALAYSETEFDWWKD